MNVLSLFDGISCGKLALKRANIVVDKYYASEIEQSSINIATYNHPDIIEIGNVSNVSYNNGILSTDNGNFEVGHIDILIGGSPCTDFSSIGYAKGIKVGQVEITSLSQYLDLKSQEVTFEGQSYLFWEYVRLLQEVKPNYFLLENVVMAKKWQQIINNTLGFEPIKINSALLSAQNRPRLYWTNIPNVSQPQDKNIKIKNILDKKASSQDVSHCKTVQQSFDKLLDKYGYIPNKFNAYNATEIRDKACTLSRGSMVTSSCATLIFVKDAVGVHTVNNGLLNNKYPTKLSNGTYNLRRLNIKEMERLQTLPDDYTNIPSVGTQKRSAAIGNGWTVDVVAYILSFLKKGV